MPFFGPLKGKENAAYPVPETLKRKNVACLLLDCSRSGERRIPRSGDALGRESASQGANGQAYAPSEVSGILFLKPKSLIMVFW